MNTIKAWMENIVSFVTDTEIFYENKIAEMKLVSQTEFDDERLVSKKKLASMDATIREVRLLALLMNKNTKGH